MKRIDDCLALLNSYHIAYKLYEHQVFGCADDFVKIPKMNGKVLKNLVLVNRQSNFFLFTVPLDCRVDLKQLAKLINSSRLSFASEAQLQDLNLVKGMVSPLSLINDDGQKITYIQAKELDEYNLVNCHPLLNTFSIDIKRNDLEQIISQVLNHKIEKIAGSIFY